MDDVTHADDVAGMSYVDHVMTPETYHVVLAVTEMALLPVTCVVGVVTNVLNSLVFYRQGLKDRMNLCLFGLALVDAGFLCSVLALLSVASYLQLEDKELGTEYAAKCQVYWAASLWASWPPPAISAPSSPWRGVSASSGRYAQPRSCALAPWGRCCWVIVLFNQLAFLFYPFKFTVVEQRDASTNGTVYGIVGSDAYRRNPLLFHVIDDIVLSTVVPVTICAIVTAATAVTVIKLRRAVAWRATTTTTTTTTSTTSSSISGSERQRGNQKQSAELTLTKRLVLLSCVYIACSLPFVTLALVRVLVPTMTTEARYANLRWALHTVATEFLAINSAVNFFVYVTRSSRFVHVLHGMICATRPFKPGEQEPTIKT
nr:hypothetical protein BaRGS_003780 [Batillaria attramentaria]